MVPPADADDGWSLYATLLVKVEALLDAVIAKLDEGGLTDDQQERLLQQRDDLIDLLTLLRAAVNAGDWQNQGEFREPDQDLIDEIADAAAKVDDAIQHDAEVETVIVAADAVLELAAKLRTGAG